jgi:hypothetical protein
MKIGRLENVLLRLLSWELLVHLRVHAIDYINLSCQLIYHFTNSSRSQEQTEDETTNIYHDLVRSSSLECIRFMLFDNCEEFETLIRFMQLSKHVVEDFPKNILECTEHHVYILLSKVKIEVNGNHLFDTWLNDTILRILELILYSDHLTSTPIISQTLRSLLKLFKSQKKHQIMLSDLFKHMLSLKRKIDADVIEQLSRIMIEGLVDAMREKKQLRRNLIPILLQMMSTFIPLFENEYNCQANSPRYQVWPYVESALVDNSPTIRAAAVEFITRVYDKQEVI